MIEALAEIVAGALTPRLARIRRHERTLWIVLISLLCALFFIGVFRFGFGDD
jgi:hypothetical protein